MGGALKRVPLFVGSSYAGAAADAAGGLLLPLLGLVLGVQIIPQTVLALWGSGALT